MDDCTELESRTDGELDLAYGGHNPQVLAHLQPMLQLAMSHAQEMETDDLFNLNYGPNLGCMRFRQQLAHFLSRHYQRQVDSARLVLTCGSTHGLHLLTSLLFSTGGTVYVEDPTYHLALGMMRDDLRLNVVPVELQEDGVDVVALEMLLVESVRDVDPFVKTSVQPYRAMVYLVPDHHNPTGLSTSPEKRVALVTLARRYDLLLVCDDVYPLLTYSAGPPAPLLVTYDPDAEHAISVGTFSKICAPGLRLGWLEAPVLVLHALDKSCLLSSGGAVNGYMSTLAASLIQLGLLDKHLQYVKTRLQDNMSVALSVLRFGLLPDSGFRLISPARGGFFLWLQCPFDTAGLELLCRTAGLSVYAGHRFSRCGSVRCVRLSVSYLCRERLVEAARLFCRLALQYSKDRVQSVL